MQCEITMTSKLGSFTDVLGDPDEICSSQPNLYSQPLSLSSIEDVEHPNVAEKGAETSISGQSRLLLNRRPIKGTGQYGEFRSVDEIDEKYRHVFSYPFFNIVQSRVIEDALYSDKSMVVCAPTGSGKTVVFEMAIVRLLMELEDRNENHDFKIIYMAPVKALCTERLTEWYSKFTKLGLLCIEVTGDTDVDFSQLKPYRIIITTPEKWDMLTRRWRDHRQLVEVIKLFLIDEVHILNDDTRGPVLEAVVSRMKTIETSVQSTHRIEQLQQQYQGAAVTSNVSPSIRFVAISATVSNPEDVATWLGTEDKPAVYYKFGDECRPVKLRRVVEGYPCSDGTSIFKFDLILNYKLWPIIQKYHNGKPTLIFCNTRKSVAMTAETLSREITISFNDEQKARLTALASTIKNKKLQTLVASGVGCHHAGLLYEERANIEQAFRNRDLPILITTTTLAMGVNLPAHLVIIKNTQQYVNGAYQEYSISTVLQMVGRAGRPQFDTEATAVIMTRLADKQRYQALVGGCEPLQSYLHKRLPENLNSEAALGTVSDVAQCVQWLRSTFLCVRAAKDPKRYLGLPQTAPHYQISKKIEELCVKAMNGLASSGLITMDEACCIESTEAGRLMSIFYLDLETMKHIMKIDGSESLERLLWIVCESHELSDMHLRIDERRCLNALNRNNATSTIRFPMKGKITTRQMKLNCVIQAILGCLPIPDPSLNQEAMKIMRITDRVCKCLVAYVTRPALITQQPKYYSAVLNSIILAKCVAANLWENSVFVSKQLKGIGPTFSTLLATAGKVNFMLLEESHPRDLERIMNKGPPAGNVLRKQISLFPKYQLTMTPIDEKVVSIQLTLLNHHNLFENMVHLTAGASHKSHVIIGDSENILLLFASFRDVDLIGLYDGRITYQVTRKHEFEHKIYAHCVSSAFAGIDTQCEYVFKDIGPPMPALSDSNDVVIRKPDKKQTTITDTFRERKRKSTDNEITQSKEKKKRQSALFEKFKNLKESFGKTSKTLKDDRSSVMSEKILQELNYLEKPYSLRAFDQANVTVTPNSVMNDQMRVASTFFEEPTKCNANDIFIEDDFIDDSKINDILNEIECEISKENGNTANAGNLNVTKDSVSKQSSATSHRPDIIKNVTYQNVDSQIEKYKAINSNRKRLNKSVPKKSNYNFIELLERNVDLSDAEETIVQEQNSFSDAIRSHIEKYLQKAKTNVKPPNTILGFIQNEPAPGKEIEPLVIVHDLKITDKDDQKTLDERDSKSDQLTTAVEDVDFKCTAKHVNALQDRIKSIDLTSDEFLKTNVQHIEELDDENDLPDVKLLGNATDNTEQSDNVNIQITEINDNPGNSNVVINKSFDEHNKTPQNIKPMLVLNEIKNEDINELSEKTEVNETTKHINERQPIINIATNDYPFQTKKTEIGMYNTNEGTDSPKVAQQQVVEIKPLALRPMEQNKMENDQIELTTVPMDTQNITHQCNYDESKENIASPSISTVPESNDKQENRVMVLWKNYIKELPLLSSNSKLWSSSVTSDATRGSENTTAAIEPNDVNINKLNAPNKLNINPDKQVQVDTVPSKTKGFIPPFKNPVHDSKIQNHNSLQVALQTPKPLQRQNRSNIDLMNVFSHEDQNEITTFSSTTCVFNNQSNTVIIPKLDNPISSNTVLKIDNNDKGDIGAHNNEIAINSHPTRIPLEMPKLMNLATEQMPDKMESLTMKEIKEINNPRISTNAHSLPLSQDENSSYTHTNTQNVTQYSFSTNKTYVTTQKTTDHSVRVIRKLKIDLDITEIISGNKKNTGNYTEIKDHKDTNQEGSIVASKKPKLAKTQGIELCASNSDCYRLDPGAHVSKLQEDSCKSLEISDVMITEITLPVQVSETKQIEEIEKDECEIDEGNEGNLDTFGKFKMEDSRAETKAINVMSILQKYSSIMRNNVRNTTDLNTTKDNEKPSISSKNNKPKRPFKISEIHRLNPTPLPEALIEIRENPDRVNVTECFNLLQPKDKQANLEKNKELNISELMITTPAHAIKPELSIDRQVAVETYEKLEDIPYCYPLSFEDIEEKNITSNIDQTMFNPKALLQCFSKDEPDIVPPPPEFCDNFNSTALDANNEEQFSMDCYEPTRYEDEVMDVPRKDNISIFQDNEQIELTPSNEIETWKLSPDEPSCKMYASPTPSLYTFTMMRKNKETSKQSSGQRPSFPRQMLNQFKFNRKKKFK